MSFVAPSPATKGSSALPSFERTLPSLDISTDAVVLDEGVPFDADDDDKADAMRWEREKEWKDDGDESKNRVAAVRLPSRNEPCLSNRHMSISALAVVYRKPQDGRQAVVAGASDEVSHGDDKVSCQETAGTQSSIACCMS